jgi:short-subunit dehydrogenase
MSGSKARTVLITGATSGIGRSLVALYVEKGFSVIACGRNQDKLAALTNDYPAINTLCFDITNAQALQASVDSIGPIDIAILNAGDCEYIDDVSHFDAELFERVVTVNLISMGYLLRAVLGKLNKNAVIALMGSSVTYLPFPRAQAYGASKAGVDYLARSLRLELAPQGYTVSLIQPGFIKTPLTDKNDFDMPFLMSSEQAANRIFEGIAKRKFLIRFPKRFIFLMKIMSMLPEKIWANMVLKGN